MVGTDNTKTDHMKSTIILIALLKNPEAENYATLQRGPDST